MATERPSEWREPMTTLFARLTAFTDLATTSHTSPTPETQDCRDVSAFNPAYTLASHPQCPRFNCNEQLAIASYDPKLSASFGCPETHLVCKQLGSVMLCPFCFPTRLLCYKFLQPSTTSTMAQTPTRANDSNGRVSFIRGLRGGIRRASPTLRDLPDLGRGK